MSEPRPRPDFRRTTIPLVLIVFGMGTMAWAAVPFYSWFCRVTGFGGTPRSATAAPGPVLDRTVTIRFDASLARGMPWVFRPVVNTMKVKIGQTALAYYEAYNPTDRPVAGTATFNVAPFSTGAYFTKIDCFCFTEQTLEPHQKVRMPVVYYVDPKILEDQDSKDTEQITLSYTFHVAPDSPSLAGK